MTFSSILYSPFTTPIFSLNKFKQIVARSALNILYKLFRFFTAAFSPSLEMVGFCNFLSIEHLPKLQRPEMNTVLVCVVKIALSALVGHAGVTRAL